jgi:hypothetical protein
MNKLQRLICAGALTFSIVKPLSSQSLSPKEYIFQGMIDKNYITFSSKDGCNLMTISGYQNGVLTKQLELFDYENNDLKLERVVSYNGDERTEFAKKDGNIGFRFFEMAFSYNLCMIEDLKRQK